MEKEYFDYYHSPIGMLEVVCSEDSVLAVEFVEKEEQGKKTNEILEKALAQLDEYFKGTRRKFDLKISMKGTAFQRQVWNGLLKIPFGETLSYKDLALRIGNEKSVRAVGNANSKNPICIIVPCHRVIGTNGDLTGYAGGLERKKWLLDHEKIKA